MYCTILHSIYLILLLVIVIKSNYNYLRAAQILIDYWLTKYKIIHICMYLYRVIM